MNRAADPPLVRALRREPVARTPVWLMRQAGRALPEYRELRARHRFLELLTTPELAAEATLQPVRRFGFDGAILFADLLTPLLPLDFEIVFAPGPLVRRPLRGPEDLGRLAPPPPAALEHAAAALRRVRAELPPEVAAIGFAGAPFTLAAYLLDGGPDASVRDLARTRAALYGRPRFLQAVLDRLADLAAAYLQLQVASGAQAVQLFDTWAGMLAEAEYRRFALPAARRVLQALAGSVPTIYFAGAAAHLLDAATESGAHCLSLDWRLPLDAARRRVGSSLALQGNLDPGALLGTPAAVRGAARDVLERNGGSPGHVFNLGHGLLPRTPLENIQALLDTVRPPVPAAP